MADLSIVHPLAGLTLLIVLAVVLWQRTRARRALRDHEESALSHPERRTPNRFD